MSTKKKKYFTVKDLNKIDKDCDYLFLLGERANGKSFSVKSKCLTMAYQSIKGTKCHKQLAYIRRYDLDCKDSVCEPYFADMPIQEITEGKYDCISIFRKRIYFANIDDEGKVKRAICIGQCFALSSAEHYKSLMFPDIFNLIYEEVISEKNQYLFSEPNKLQQLVSSILRDRKGKVYLIGNTLSRMCPYYGDFGLNKIENIELGETRLFTIDNTRIKVHRTKSSNYNSGMFFGNASKNITQGEYLTDIYPHLPKPLRTYREVYKLVLKYEGFMYLMRFLKGKENYFWYVEPKTSEIQPHTRVVALEYNPSIKWTHGFIPLSDGEVIAFKYIKNKEIVYSDNLTGTEFNNILVNFI